MWKIRQQQWAQADDVCSVKSQTGEIAAFLTLSATRLHQDPGNSGRWIDANSNSL
jgi:hypothetical protein